VNLDKDKSLVAWIGTGVMGRSMAAHLLKDGWKLKVFNRTKEKAQDLIDAGAEWMESPGECAEDADAVFTIVGFPHDVREVYLGDDGILARGKPDALLCDMTTSEPSLAQEIATKAAERGMMALDAPVSGGDIGAREARLSIMVGGPEEAFDAALPLFNLMGKQIVRQGEAGAGQHTKMCNQINVAGTLIGVVESLLYAKKSGLDPHVMLESVGSGAASSWALLNLAPRILDGNFDPGFYVRHFIKDMDIAIAEAEKLGIQTPALRLVRELYDKVVELGGENYGTQALYLALEKM